MSDLGAFFVGELDVSVQPPRLVRTGIRSSPAKLLTTVRGRFLFDIVAFEGEPFHERRQKLIRYLRSPESSWLDWAKLYLDGSER